MKTRTELYTEVIQRHLEYFRINKMKFKMFVSYEKEDLPVEAYSYDYILHLDFNFGSEETWTADQIKIVDGIFNCILVYSDGLGGWTEYPTSFPVQDIIQITEADIYKQNFIYTCSPEQVELSRQAFKYLSGQELI
jgi:hypothetical protein